jgi:hypothetical protein
MARQNINIGAYANDGTGDDLRSAFEKVNSNMLELYSTVYGANVGALPPTSGVEEGELWWSTVEGRMYVKYGSAWVDASPSDGFVTYDLTSESTTGGANLQLNGTDLSVDTIKFASGPNVTVTRTDANTITLSSVSYTGDVTGNLTGNSTGTHTGAVVGNVTGNTEGIHTGDVAGNVTGNLTGLHTGDVVGNVTGNLTGNVTGDTTGTHYGALSGNADTATKFLIAKDINGVAFDGTQDIVITASADTLYGTSLNSTVVNSQLTSVGTLTDLTVTNTITGSVSGNAGTVTNGVYTTGDQTIGGIKTFSDTITGSISGNSGTVSSISTHPLSELSDVSSTTPNDGQVLTWSSTSSTWTPGAGGGLTQVENDTSPLLGGNLGLNGHHIYGPGDVQTTVFGVSVEALNSLVSLMLESNSLTINLGTFTQPTGYQSNTNGYTLDMGFFSDDPIVNNIDFGTFV